MIMLKMLRYAAVMWVFCAALAAFSQQGPGVLPSPGQDAGAAGHRENHDPLLDLPELPKNRVTLVGGTVRSLDEVMNRMVIQPFGGKKTMQVRFDSRTRFFRDGQPITLRDIQRAQRVYADTMLNGDRIFAKTIWIQTAVENGVSHGQITNLDVAHGTFTLRDELSEQPVKFHLAPNMVVKRGEQAGTVADRTVTNLTVNDLKEGTLVSLRFSPERQVSEVTLLAAPGSAFSFAGRITYLDMSRKLIAIANDSDGKSYDVYMDAIAESIQRQLREGATVSVSAVFDGNRYSARQIEVAALTPQR
jgi:hypothetical protein